MTLKVESIKGREVSIKRAGEQHAHRYWGSNLNSWNDLFRDQLAGIPKAAILEHGNFSCRCSGADLLLFE